MIGPDYLEIKECCESVCLSPDCTHREKGLDNVGLDRAEGFVSDQNEDLLLFLQTDEVPKPGPLGQSAKRPVN